MDEYTIEEEKYRKILNSDPLNAEAHYGLGNILFAKEKFEDAEEEFKIAIHLNPKFADAYNAMGKLFQVYAEKARVKHINEWNSEIILPDPKKFLDAERMFKRAIEIDPYYVEAYNNLGNLMFKLGRLNEAKFCYEKILQILPDFAEGHYNLASVFFVEENFDDAEKECLKAIKIDENFAEAYEILGLILIKKGKTTEGMKYLDKAVFLKPELREEIDEVKSKI